MAQNFRPKSSRAPPSVSFTLSTLTVTFVTDHIDESTAAQREGQHVTNVKEEAQNDQQTEPSASDQGRANDVPGDVHSPATKKCNCRYLWSCSLHGLNQFMQVCLQVRPSGNYVPPTHKFKHTCLRRAYKKLDSGFIRVVECNGR